jgi:hypothetical protein
MEFEDLCLLYQPHSALAWCYFASFFVQEHRLFSEKLAGKECLTIQPDELQNLELVADAE